MNRTVVLTCFLFFCLLKGYNQNVKEIILQPDSIEGKDATVRWIANTNLEWGDYQNSNFGRGVTLSAYDYTWSGTEVIVRSLFQFDLSSIPYGSTITEASLSLYNNPASEHSVVSGSNAVVLRRVLSDWNEMTVTFNNCPEATVDNQVVVGGTSSLHQDHENINVTELVKDMYSKGNFGFLMQLATEEYYRSLQMCSSDHEISTKRPKLVVSYIEPEHVVVYDTTYVTVFDTTYVSVFDTTHVEVFDTTFITVTDTLIIDVLLTGIGNTKKSVIKLYPNPTSQYLYIDIANHLNVDGYSILINNEAGSQVFSTSISLKKYILDFTDFGGRGLYFVRLINDKGVVVENRKILLE